MPCKRKLAFGREDAHPVVSLRMLRLQQEGGLAQVGPGSDVRHLLICQGIRTQDHRQRVALEGHRREDINLVEGVTCHRTIIPATRCCRPRAGWRDPVKRSPPQPIDRDIPERPLRLMVRLAAVEAYVLERAVIQAEQKAPLAPHPQCNAQRVQQAPEAPH
jgi:hypothetical protein